MLVHLGIPWCVLLQLSNRLTVLVFTIIGWEADVVRRCGR